MNRQAHAPSTTTLALVSLVASLALAGCGDLTAGGLAETEVVLSGDAPEAEGTSAHAARSTSFEPVHGGSGEAAERFSSPSSAQPVGDIRATLEVEIQGPDGQWISLTGGLQEATVDISGTVEADLGTRSLDPGLYPRIRVRFTGMRAEVESGLPVPGPATIDVDFGGAGSATAERELNLDLSEDQSVEILVDLNSTQWLMAADFARNIVAASKIREELDVRVR